MSTSYAAPVASGCQHAWPPMAAETQELTRTKLTVPMLAWGGAAAYVVDDEIVEVMLGLSVPGI
jgi:hypothetical protein